MVQRHIPTEWDPRHLGWPRFEAFFDLCQDLGLWPIRRLWLGKTGRRYSEAAQGREARPRFMVETMDGRRRAFLGRSLQQEPYDPEHMWEWTPGEIRQIFRR